MRLNNAASAVAVPLWMVIITAILFIARVILMVNDKSEETKSPLNWLTPKQFAAIKLKPDQLVLYDFSATWCGPCKLMDKTTFRDKNVINELNKRFVLVRVMDPDAATPAADKTEIKHLQQRFEVTAFPEFVAALANGSA